MSGAALADGGGMSPLTGDSYAYFHDLQYVPGTFNSATRVAQLPNGVSVQPVASQSQAANSMRSYQTANQQVASQFTFQLTIAPSKVFNDRTGA
ncbi:MAG: hypothetical protein ACREX6_07610 [Casimicrobiaceae bacterium]